MSRKNALIPLLGHKNGLTIRCLHSFYGLQYNVPTSASKTLFFTNSQFHLLVLYMESMSKTTKWI